MSTDGAIIATRPISCRSAPNSAPSSPNDRVKFLCSYGGRILPRPSDGLLKYVGGETRVVTVPRDITFQELMTKLTSMLNGEIVLKYQVLSEDLDALVSVKSDEDLRHMFEEIDRYDSAGSPRLRAFLFPRNPVVVDSSSGSVEPPAPEQRYIDSINGVIRHIPNHMKQHPAISTMQCNSLPSSACSSPRSPDSYTAETAKGEFLLPSIFRKSGSGGMHRVRSSPSISSLSNHQQHSSQYVHPPYHHHYRHGHHLACYQLPKHHIESHKTGFLPVRSTGRLEGVKYQVDAAGSPHHHYAFRQNRGTGLYSRCMPYDDYSNFSERRIMDRPRSLAGSPTLSPRYGQSGMKAWDSIIMPGRAL